jgi:asparagine synthase (glutamine-hydrolysing)
MFWYPRFRVMRDLSETEWVEETRRQLTASVQRHMLSDVPVGSFLSGGVDSSAVTAVMASLSDAPVKAFTIGFPGSSIDETEEAARTARHLGCEHIVLRLEPAATADLLPAVQAAFDEPCAASSAVPHWHLARLASEHVKVVLCGEGSDEIFAGYKRQRTAMAAARWSGLLKMLGPINRIADLIPEAAPYSWNYLRQNARRFRDSAMLESSFQRFFAGTQISSPEVRADLYEPSFRAEQEGAGAFARLESEYFGTAAEGGLEPLQQFMLADLTVHMPGSLLNRLDRTSMAHSVEARVPFLSHDFVDWCLTMPISMKVRGGLGKYALRRAVEPWLPKVAQNKRKLGFQLPFAQWFRGDFSAFAREAWHESGAAQAGYLRPPAVDRLFAEHSGGKANHSRVLFAIAMFGIWWRQQSDTRQHAPLGAMP